MLVALQCLATLDFVLVQPLQKWLYTFGPSMPVGFMVVCRNSTVKCHMAGLHGVLLWMASAKKHSFFILLTASMRETK